MEKYKVCPVCGMHNNPVLLECMGCEADLQNVPVVDEEIEKAEQKRQETKNTEQEEQSITLVRICECGAKNPVQARKCAVCGEDISMIIPTPDQELQTACAPKLRSLDGTYSYEIKSGTTVIGREHEMKDFLLPKPYVSRKHAELQYDEQSGELKIRNCNHTNYTYVNNKKLDNDSWQEVCDGDEIGLGGNSLNGNRQNDAGYLIVEKEI